MKKRNIVLILMSLSMILCHSVSIAQVSLDNDLTKEIRKQVKQLKKEGWKIVDGEKTMEEQLSVCLQYSLDSCCIVESSTQVSSSYRMGYTIAHAKALGALASKLESKIRTENELTTTNQNVGLEVESSIQFQNQLQSHSDEMMNEAFPVLVLTRELPNGACEVQVHMAVNINKKVKAKR